MADGGAEIVGEDEVDYDEDTSAKEKKWGDDVQ